MDLSIQGEWFGKLVVIGPSSEIRHGCHVTGRRFGKLTAIRRLDAKSTTSYKWLCQCDCGTTTEVSVANLTGGAVRSCGCLRTGPRAAKKEKPGEKGAGSAP